MSRAQLTSTVEQNSAGAASPFLAGKNKIINGDFGVWQRGTTLNLTNNVEAFLADRFIDYALFSTGTTTVSQQAFTPGTAPVAGYESSYFHRAALSSGATYYSISQKIEDVRIFANQTVTLSFWAKTSTATSATLYLRQDFGTGGSSAVDITTTISTTTAWARYSFTTTLASLSGKTIGTGSSLRFIGVFNTSVASMNIDIWGMQLEAGSVATPFTTASGTVQGELALCQRYLPVTSSGDDIFGYSYSTTATYANFKFPVQARVAPTGITTTAASNYYVYNGSLSGAAATGVSFNNAGLTNGSIVVNTTAGSPTLTVGQGAKVASVLILWTGCEL